VNGTPAHDWLRPQLERLLAEAEEKGINRATSVAVLTDLLAGPEFNPTRPETDIPMD